MLLTIRDIRDCDPCYDPTKFLPEGWTGTLVDVLSVEACPMSDRIWVACQILAWRDRPKLTAFAKFCTEATRADAAVLEYARAAVVSKDDGDAAAYVEAASSEAADAAAVAPAYESQIAFLKSLFEEA
jgi:hypothetical protein